MAGNRIQVGEHLAELPMSVDYLRDGEIGYSHLAVMARTAEALGKRFEELLPIHGEVAPKAPEGARSTTSSVDAGVGPD